MYEKVVGKLKLIRNKFAEILCKLFVAVAFVGLVYSLTIFVVMCLLDFYWVNEATIIFLTSMVLILLSKKMGY